MPISYVPSDPAASRCVLPDELWRRIVAVATGSLLGVNTTPRIAVYPSQPPRTTSSPKAIDL